MILGEKVSSLITFKAVSKVITSGKASKDR
jgi:hypothetical protein